MTVYLQHNVDAGHWAWTRDEGPGRVWTSGFDTKADAAFDACPDGEEIITVADTTRITWFDPSKEFWAVRPVRRVAEAIVSIGMGRLSPGGLRSLGHEVKLVAFDFPEEDGRPALIGWEIRSGANLLDRTFGDKAESFEAAKEAAVVALVKQVLGQEVM